LDISYREAYQMNREGARKQIVDTYLVDKTLRAVGSVSRVARIWHTSRNVVRKWSRRFEDEGEENVITRLLRASCPDSPPKQ